MLLRTIAPSTPATLAVGQHQYAYIFQGNRTRPTRLDLTTNVAEDMGMDAPATAPSVAMSGTPTYYVARIDVIEGGVGYYKAPAVTIEGGEAAGTQKAEARAFLSGGALGEIQATKNGRGYTGTPTVTLSASYATGATFTAVLDDSPPTSASGTGSMSSYTVDSEQTDLLCLPGFRNGSFTALDFNGSVVTTWSTTDANGNEWSRENTFSNYNHSVSNEVVFRVIAPNFTGYERASVLLTFTTVLRVVEGIEYGYAARLKNLQWENRGTGYIRPVFLTRPNLILPDNNSKPDILDCGTVGTKSLIIRLDSPISLESQQSGTEGYKPIKSVTFTPGSGYVTPPVINIESVSGGFGADLVPVVKDGKVTGVTVKKPGLYPAAPTLTVDGGGAVAQAIMRAHIRGKYDCYYRYIDGTAKDRGGPIPSNLSPVTTIDAGDGVGKLKWTFAPAASKRAVGIELWRTTSDEAYTVYRVASLPATATTFEEDFTDLELQDFERDGYAAMPVFLPNGELNANRFGIPPSNKTVAVMFQDRLWMAVDTGGRKPNVLKFSEYNEPESCPDINELAIQTNVKGHDHITALVPYGASLGVMQTRHSYRLSYVSQPLLDASLQVAAYRGCLNQRCWDEFEGLIYCMDTQGVYAMDQGGQVQPLSLGIRDLFDEKIDFSKSDWFSVTADRKTRCLRVAVRLHEDDGGKYPTRMYCYSFDSQGWWEERYPAPLVGSATVRDYAGVSRCLYGGADGKMFEVNSGDTDLSLGSVLSIAVTDAGAGYTKPPRVWITGDGVGAVAEAAVAGDGSLLGVYLRYGGYGYTKAFVNIESPLGGRVAAAIATCGDEPFASIPCWFKTGNMEYPHDTLPVQMQDKSRNVGMLFTPTAGPCKMKLRMYYNNSPHPRINVAARDRGTGVVYETQEPCVTLDMDANLLPDRISTGVCRALFSSHTVDDIQGNDRHVAIELSAERSLAGPIEIHSVDVFGTPEV